MSAKRSNIAHSIGRSGYDSLLPLLLIEFVRAIVANWQKSWPKIAALLMLLTGCGSGNKRVLEEVSEKVYAVEPSANISIHNCDGAVLVYGSNVNEVRVRSLKRAVQPRATEPDRDQCLRKTGRRFHHRESSSPAKMGVLGSFRHD